uniref:Variant surface glycoprotein 1125.1068 n=1 Tax=Trypanosoma brucei TaxID=5691 RepID=A0A1J0R661_9TRYP|nr:variant surface glycoprotein 1125.1068 [Trypanosoma brucei]
MLASLIIPLLFASAVNAAAPDEGSNSGDFAALCEVINLARNSPDQITTPEPADDILKAAALINITLNSPGTLDLITKTEDKATAIKDNTSPLGKACISVGQEICLTAANRYATHKDSELYKQWFKLRNSEQSKRLVRHLAEQIRTTHELLKRQVAEADTAAAQADLKTALGPQPDGKAELKLSGTSDNRAQLCGANAATTKGTVAGKNLATGAICLCGIDASQTQTKVCSKAVTVTGANLADGQTDVNQQWQKIAAACEAQASGNPTTAATIRAALTNFRHKIAIGKGTDSKLTNVLGSVTGDGSAGCTGSKDDTKGTCVFYGASKTDHGLASIAWAAKMATAANKLETAQKAADEAFRLHTHLITLNNSLTAAVFTPETQNQNQPKPDTNKKTTETNKKGCEAIQNKNDCKSNGNCKWTKETEEAGKYCELNETKAEKQTTEAGAGEKKDGPATTGCAKHGTDKAACENDKTGDKQNCAWRKGKDNEPDL